MARRVKQKGQQSVTRSFNHAYRGLVYAVRTQRNMQVHVIIAALVLGGSLLVGVTALELAGLVLTIVVVMIAEMFNTALEFTVDLVTKEYHPLAKLAKDVSAGAVLVTSAGAVLVGYLILADNLSSFSFKTLEAVQRWPGHLTLVALILVTILVLLGKAFTKSPDAFTGGMPSGHAAVAFAGWIAATFIAFEANAGRLTGLISLITLLMALLVCQSRVESGTHTIYQVVTGALVGTLITVAVFQFL